MLAPEFAQDSASQETPMNRPSTISQEYLAPHHQLDHRRSEGRVQEDRFERHEEQNCPGEMRVCLADEAGALDWSSLGGNDKRVSVGTLIHKRRRFGGSTSDAKRAIVKSP